MRRLDSKLFSRLSRSTWVMAALATLMAAGTGCSGNDRPDGGLPDGLVIQLDGSPILLDGQVADLAQVPDVLPTNQEGPSITVDVPTDEETVVGTVLKVRATITDPDGIDAQTVKVTLQGQEDSPIPMGLTVTPNVYEALLDISSLGGAARLWVVGADLLGNENSEIRNFNRDPGPVVRYLSPGESSRHKGSVSLQVLVADIVEVTSFEVRIGVHPLTLTEISSDAQRTVYAATVRFDDPAFGLSLSGKQVLTATAVNANGAKTVEPLVFFVDDVGPTISITSHEEGQLIGSIIEIEAEITDPAGMLDSSVKCIVGNELENRTLILSMDPLDAKKYRGQFDTRTLSDEMLWPVMSFRAADKLGNESHRDIQVALDNGPPLIALDPPEDFIAMRESESFLECSRPFDPVGSDAADDLNLVPQVVKLRARIEDMGNFVPSTWKVVSTVDRSSVWLYALHENIGKPLVVDTDGDTYCDAINPEVIPVSSDPRPDQAVAVNLAPIDPAGGADFRPWAAPPAVILPPPPVSICFEGTDDVAPDSVCDVTPLTQVITYLTSKEPAIWSIPPSVSGDDLRCMGLPFDFLANEIPNGWVCAAVSARDKLGNLGVSVPVRLWVDHSARWRGVVPAAAQGTEPNCTGTLDKNTGVVNNQPCQFRTLANTDPCTSDAECTPPGKCISSAGSATKACLTKWPHFFENQQRRKF